MIDANSGKRGNVMKENIRQKWEKVDPLYIVVPLTVLVALWVVAAFTGMWPWKENAYNSYALQTEAWLQGRLDLGKDYPWLELAIYEGKYFVSFPPFPSYILLPFVFLFGTKTPDHFIALTTTVIGTIYAIKLYREIGKENNHTQFWVLMLYLASGYLFVGMNGYVWFIAQSMSFTLSLMAIYYALLGKGGWSLAFWACSVGCRPMLALYGVLLIYLLWTQWKKENPQGKLLDWVKKRWYWAIGCGSIAISYMILNFARFGNILEFGHNYLPEFTRTTTGQFNLVYLEENIKKYFRLPQTTADSGALQFYSADGMAFWLIGPIFITIIVAWLYAIVKKRKGNMVLLCMLPILTSIHLFIICCHRTLGGWQFGNRYLLDMLPYLFLGLALWKPEGERFMKWNIPLFSLGFAINLIGTVATYNNWI